MRILGIVSYQGANYQGWQKQPLIPTIQGKIEEVLSQFFNTGITIYGSGRTDAGVHAYGQTFHFDIEKNEIDLDRLLYSINQMLPEDISIISFDMVEDDFHARLSAKAKEYIYIIETVSKDPFLYPLADIEKEPFDLDKFQECLALFKGQHNFQNFTSKEEDQRHFVRTIINIEININKPAVTIFFTGDGFMRYMIRYLVGTALAYARDMISLDEVKALLNADKDERKIVSFKAPASGLFLNRVIY